MVRGIRLTKSPLQYQGHGFLSHWSLFHQTDFPYCPESRRRFHIALGLWQSLMVKIVPEAGSFLCWYMDCSHFPLNHIPPIRSNEATIAAAWTIAPKVSMGCTSMALTSVITTGGHIHAARQQSVTSYPKALQPWFWPEDGSLQSACITSREGMAVNSCKISHCAILNAPPNVFFFILAWNGWNS